MQSTVRLDNDTNHHVWFVSFSTSDDQDDDKFWLTFSWSIQTLRFVMHRDTKWTALSISLFQKYMELLSAKFAFNGDCIVLK